MTHPSVYSFVFILICLQMLQASGAGNRWNNVPHHTIKPATQFRHFSASSAVSVCVSCSSYRFQVICQKGGREQEVSLPRKPFLKELGSTARSSWPLECSGSENGAELEGRMGGHLRHSLSPPAFGDQVTYTRGFRAALSAANSSQSSRLVMLLMRSRSPRPGCLGRILQVSLGIHQHWTLCCKYTCTLQAALNGLLHRVMDASV